MKILCRKQIILLKPKFKQNAISGEKTYMTLLSLMLCMLFSVLLSSERYKKGAWCICWLTPGPTMRK